MNILSATSANRQLQQSTSLFWTFYSILENMALARFQWDGLPSTVNSDDIERLLYENGSVSIAAMMNSDGFPNHELIYALPYASEEVRDVYGYPRRWWTTAPNDRAMNYEANQMTGTTVFNNLGAVRLGSVPDMYMCLEFAGELEDIALARRVNRNATKTPYIIKVPRSLKRAAEAVLNKVEGNESAILAVDDLNELVKIEVLKTEAKFMVEEYEQDERNIWNRAFTALGISNIPYKSERMIEDEVLSQDESTNLVEMSALKERRRAAAHLNTLFDLHISVTPSRIPYPANLAAFNKANDSDQTDNEEV